MQRSQRLAQWVSSDELTQLGYEFVMPIEFELEPDTLFGGPDLFLFKPNRHRSDHPAIDVRGYRRAAPECERGTKLGCRVPDLSGSSQFLAGVDHPAEHSGVERLGGKMDRIAHQAGDDHMIVTEFSQLTPQSGDAGMDLPLWR